MDGRFTKTQRRQGLCTVLSRHKELLRNAVCVSLNLDSTQLVENLSLTKYLLILLDSVAWAELYLSLSMLVSRFDLEFVGTEAADIECGSDQFVLGQKRQGGVKVYVTKRVS